MLYGEIIGNASNTQGSSHDVFRCLDLGRKWIQVVLGIEIEVDAMIPECFHICFTARWRIALRIRWAHVRGILSDDVGERSLVLDHLLLSHIRGDVLKAVVGPGVRSNLMSFVDHTLDDRRVRSCCINGTFAEIVARYEECSVEAEALQRIQQFACVQVWPVVIGQRNDIFLHAIIDVVVV